MKSLVIIAILFIGFIFLNSFPNAVGEPILFDENLILEKYAGDVGWGYTTMTFVGEDILLLEKSGFVSLVLEEEFVCEDII